MFATIRSRLLWLVGLSLAPAMAILAYDQYAFRRQALLRLQGDVQRVVAQASERLEQQIDGARARAGLLVQFPEIRAVDSSADRLLANALANDPLYANLAVVDLHGRVVSSALPVSRQVDVGTSAFFRNVVRERRFAVGTFVRNPITPRMTLNLGAPITDAQGTLRGVLWLALGLDWTGSFMRFQQLPPDAVLLINTVRSSSASTTTAWPAGNHPQRRILSDTVSLTPGDTFVLFSDGVSEAMNMAEDFFGDPRLIETLAPLTEAPVEASVAAVMAAVQRFAAGAQQSDDITVVAARFGPA